MTNNKEYWNNLWKNCFTEDGMCPGTMVVKMYDLLKDKDIKKILDLGAGKGRDSLWLAQQGFEVTALDISEEALRYLAQCNPKIQTICCDMLHFEAKEQYDWVVANLSLHYWDDEQTQKIVAQIYQSLKVGGWFSLRCKSVDDADYGIGERIGENIYQKEHIRHFFSLEYTKDLLKNFKIELLEKTNVTEKHYGSYSAVDALVQKI